MHDRVNRLRASGVGHPGAALRILQQESCSDACILVRAAVAALRFHEPCERHRLRTYTKLGELVRVTSPHLTSTPVRSRLSWSFASIRITHLWVRVNCCAACMRACIGGQASFANVGYTGRWLRVWLTKRASMSRRRLP
jgi:hypothetical protein